MCAFVVLGLVFFHTKPRDWLVEMSPKWPILCREGQNRNSSQSSNQFYCLCVVGTTMHEESWTKSTDKDLYISLRKSRATLLKLTAIVNKPLTDSFPACVVTETQRLTVYCRADFPVDFSFFFDFCSQDFDFFVTPKITAGLNTHCCTMFLSTWYDWPVKYCLVWSWQQVLVEDLVVLASVLTVPLASC